MNRPAVCMLLFVALVHCQETEKEECINGDSDLCDGVACTADYNPVCGCDGKTYSNRCVADCSGVPSYTEGEC